MGFQRHHSALIVASVITVASFIGASVYTQNGLARVDALSSTIEQDAVPSIDHLSRAAVGLTRLNQLLDEVAVGGPRRQAALAAARQEMLGVDREVQQYLQLPTLRGERRFWAALRGDVGLALE